MPIKPPDHLEPRPEIEVKPYDIQKLLELVLLNALALYQLYQIT
ncbi:hypothetical protein [Acinetobacter baumannii]|nr:hypothetical protein [Acinetobacter baumannii]MDV5263233.1 hypothetical protein [Acinetobacter baumannii]